MYGILGYSLGSEHAPDALLHCASKKLTTDSAESKIPGAASDAVRPFMLRVAVAKYICEFREHASVGGDARICEADDVCKVEHECKDDDWDVAGTAALSGGRWQRLIGTHLSLSLMKPTMRSAIQSAGNTYRATCCRVSRRLFKERRGIPRTS